MTVKELKKFLENLPKEYDKAKVILQKDREGNGYSPLAGADFDCIYVPENPWSGEIISTNWSADDACMDEKEWKDFKKQPRCLVLFPVN